jgi:hypothetical protein
MSPPGIRGITGDSGGPRPSQPHLGRLSASSDVDAATWILVALRDFDHTVGSIVPPVFEAYARIFHPASRGAGDDEVAVRWADVAEANGREMHPAAEWGSITGSWDYQRRSNQPGLWDGPPSTGELPGGVALRLVPVLSAHTDDPDQGFFGIWEGWGTGTPMFLFTEDTPEKAKQHAREAFDAEATAWRGLVDSAASFNVPQRPMHLLCGPLAAIEDFYERYDGRSSLCLRNPPSLWWPADKRWCAGTDVDLMTTYVGGSSAAVQTLLADDQLEVLAVPDNQSVTWEADRVNPLPEPPS